LDDEAKGSFRYHAKVTKDAKRLVLGRTVGMLEDDGKGDQRQARDPRTVRPSPLHGCQILPP